MSADPLANMAAALAGLASSSAGARPEPVPAGAQSLWRYQLERAQWRLHVDSRPAPAAPARVAGESASRNPRGALQSRQDPVRAEGARAASADAGRDSAAPQGRNGTLQSAPVDKAAPSPGAGAFGTAQRPLASARQAAPETRAARPQQRTPWPEVNAHVSVEGRRVKAWIRDASLGEAERAGLIARLRARLRGAGLELESLTVNGREESI